MAGRIYTPQASLIRLACSDFPHADPSAFVRINSSSSFPAGKRRERSLPPSAGRNRPSIGSFPSLKAAFNHAFKQKHVVSREAWLHINKFRGADSARIQRLTQDQARRTASVGPRRKAVHAARARMRYCTLKTVNASEYRPPWLHQTSLLGSDHWMQWSARSFKGRDCQ